MMSQQQVIHIHAAAPPKPAWGGMCNGCGVCCLAEPCPVGAVVSRKLYGRCDALRWAAGEQRYRCGMVEQPGAVLPWLPAPLSPWVARLTRRWISAGQGCDSDAEAGA